MLSFNRGEWSELYGILFLLIKPKLKIVNENLHPIKTDLFLVKEIILDSKLKLSYKIIKDNIAIFVAEKEYKKLSVLEVDITRKELLNKVLSAKSGSFEIPSIEDFLLTMTSGVSFNSRSKNKGDVRIISLDKRAKKEVELTYSIKSSLGSPATIFNASKKTNFKYEIKGINAVDVAIINLIETETKLLDRIKKIHELGGIVSFDSVVSNALDYNLRMIDSNLPTYLGNTLLYSYENNNKDLKEIFIKANQFSDKKLGYKKLGDFLDGTSFGFIPSIKWDGIRTVNGGLLIIKDDGEVVILDLTYFKESVLKYMINESKLDSPSSTRFRMLEVYKENGKFFFTLNLQVRYKK